LGKIADNKKENVYFFCLFSLIIILLCLIFFKNYIVMLIVVFFASTLFELISLANKGMINRLADKTHLGEIDGSLNGIAASGAFIGPLLFGLLFDLFSLNIAYFVLILLTASFSFVILRRIKKIAL